MTGRTGGVYIPPFKLAQMRAQMEAEGKKEDKTSKEYQRMTWEALRKSINGLINKVRRPTHPPTLPISPFQPPSPPLPHTHPYHPAAHSNRLLLLLLFHSPMDSSTSSQPPRSQRPTHPPTHSI